METDDGQAARIETLRRSAGVGLTRDGQFTYGGQPVAHPRVQRLFHQGVGFAPSGEPALTVGRWWCYLNADGVLRFVDRVGRDAGDGVSVAVLRDGQEVSWKGAVLGYALDDDRFYAWFPGLRGPARLAREAHQALVAAVASLSDSWVEAGSAYIVSLDVRIVVLATAPGPDTPAPAVGAAESVVVAEG
jgi:hypothetical protein